MDWRTYEKDIEHYYSLSDEERQAIAKSGIQTEFWKLFRAYLCNTLRQAELAILHASTISLDDLMILARKKEAHKSVSEVLNLIEMFVNPPKKSALPLPRPRASEVVENPRRVIKKEI